MCTRCGTKFTDDRWGTLRGRPWAASESDGLCGPCAEAERAQREAERVARRQAEEAAAQAVAEAETKKKPRRLRGRSAPVAGMSPAACWRMPGKRRVPQGIGRRRLVVGGRAALRVLLERVDGAAGTRPIPCGV
ncbi:hypothetical protein GCM10020000_81390 [Streptomyces olivoverticillatus]